MHTGRNDPCPCGSGRKYKRCCLNRQADTPMPYKVLIGLGGVVVVVCIVLLVSSIRNFGF